MEGGMTNGLHKYFTHTHKYTHEIKCNMPQGKNWVTIDYIPWTLSPQLGPLREWKRKDHQLSLRK